MMMQQQWWWCLSLRWWSQWRWQLYFYGSRSCMSPAVIPVVPVMVLLRERSPSA